MNIHRSSKLNFSKVFDWSTSVPVRKYTNTHWQVHSFIDLLTFSKFVVLNNIYQCEIINNVLN